MIPLNMDYFRNWQQWYMLVCVYNIKRYILVCKNQSSVPNRITVLTTKQELNEEGYQQGRAKPE